MALDAASFQPAARDLLQDPANRLWELIETFKKWLYLPDVGALKVVLAAFIANLIAGDPVWLLLVGPPGSGKTETIHPLASLPKVCQVATLTEAALLSGTPKRERSAQASGGLLRTIGDSGLLLLKDFGSILSMRPDPRAGLLAALREIFDGSWTRHLGTDGGQTLSWTGKCGLIAGCTPAIDTHHAVMASLGERFILYRLPEAPADELASVALAHVGRERDMRAEIATATMTWFEGLSLPSEPQTVPTDDLAFLIALSTLVVRCRSAVERDRYSRDIEYVHESEAPTRLVTTLAQLLAGMRVIGIDDVERRRLILKTALDCLPVLRRGAIEYLAVAGVQATSQIARVLNHPTSTVRRALGDLAVHSVLKGDSEGRGLADLWELTEWARDRWEALH